MYCILILIDCGLHFVQLENDAELTAHIHQVKELELRLKQLTEDTSTKRLQKQTVTMAIQVDTMSKQLMSLEEQLELQQTHCTELSEDLQRSYKEVHLHTTMPYPLLFLGQNHFMNLFVKEFPTTVMSSRNFQKQSCQLNKIKS